MLMQISSGQGPVECELAVCKLFDALKKEFPDIELVDKHESRFSNGCTSIKLKTKKCFEFFARKCAMDMHQITNAKTGL